MNAQPPINALLTPQQTRNALRSLSRQLPAKDPLAKLLMQLANADLACRNELWADDFDSAEMAIDALPDIFQQVMGEIQDAFDYAKEPAE